MAINNNNKARVNRSCETDKEWKKYSLYLLGPSSRQNVNVNCASSSKNSFANESHQQLSLSCRLKIFGLRIKVLRGQNYSLLFSVVVVY